MSMTPQERAVRFQVASEIVREIYSDYCNDNTKTREQAYEFCDFVRTMNEFDNKLKLEVNEHPT